ncbi:MAG: sialidase family protein [Planctomycetota bacterium]|nr:sialidase family protein [Planctomycetota bacterium]
MSHHHAPLSRPIILGLLAIGIAVAAAALDTTASAADKPAQDAFQITKLLPPGPGNPRNSEGDFIKLADGRILFVYTHFTGGGSDHATAHLAGRFSSDGGKTWTDKDTLVLANEGGFNIMSVSLLRLQDGRIALFYARKNSHTDCRPIMRISTDEAKT